MNVLILVVCNLGVIAAEWWRQDVEAVLLDFLRTGGDPNTSDALTINGQPGDLYPCSKSGLFAMISTFYFCIS